jgi:hypothetical protein
MGELLEQCQKDSLRQVASEQLMRATCLEFQLGQIVDEEQQEIGRVDLLRQLRPKLWVGLCLACSMANSTLMREAFSHKH